MKYENVKFNVGNEEFDVVHCLGDGQCECKSCKEKGKYTVSWTSWFYKLDENDKGVLCRDCLREILIQRRIDKVMKELWNDITSYYFALRVLGNCTVELDKLAEFWHKRGVEVE